MLKNSGTIYIVMLAMAVFLLSSDKGVAGYEKNMLEFVSPSELSGGEAPSHDHIHQYEEICVHGSKACAHGDVPVELKPEIPSHVEPQQAQIIDVPRENKKNASYKLGSGDKIKVTVLGEEELSDTYLVNEEGFISMILIGDIKVKGQTIQDVKNIILSKLSDGYLVAPSVAIEVAQFRPIYVMGEVQTPGQYSFVTDMTVRNAVAIAGGFTYRANQKHVRILRELNKHSTYQIEGVEPDMKIEPGDTVLIKERFF